MSETMPWAKALINIISRNMSWNMKAVPNYRPNMSNKSLSVSPRSWLFSNLESRHLWLPLKKDKISCIIINYKCQISKTSFRSSLQSLKRENTYEDEWWKTASTSIFQNHIWGRRGPRWVLPHQPQILTFLITLKRLNSLIFNEYTKKCFKSLMLMKVTLKSK